MEKGTQENRKNKESSNNYENRRQTSILASKLAVPISNVMSNQAIPKKTEDSNFGIWKPDIIRIRDTWVNSSHDCNESIQGLTLFRKLEIRVKVVE